MTTQMSEVDIAAWRDRKRYLWLMGLIAPTALFIVLLTRSITGSTIEVFGAPYLLMVVFAITLPHRSLIERMRPSAGPVVARR